MSNIKEYRLKKGLTQEALADALSVSRPTVTCWEIGVNTPRTEILLKLASILDCTVDDLLRPKE